MADLVLSDLVAPLALDRFLSDHWAAETPWLGHLPAAALDALLAHPLLSSGEEVLSRLGDQIVAFGPGGERTPAPPSEASAFLARGHNLYLPDVQRQVPELVEVFTGLVEELGIVPPRVFLEGFIGVGGGVSTRHFDHDFNFQILLRGNKRWLLEPNREVISPLRPVHPPAPAAWSSSPQELLAGPGDVLFVPRGYWHEVVSLTPTWCINLVVKGATWAELIASALRSRLEQDAGARGYATAHFSAEELARVKRVAGSALAELGLDELVLASDPARYRWRAATSARALIDGELHVGEDVIEVDDAFRPVLARLVAMTGEFRLVELRELPAQLGLSELHALLVQLEELKVLERL